MTKSSALIETEPEPEPEPEDAELLGPVVALVQRSRED